MWDVAADRILQESISLRITSGYMQQSKSMAKLSSAKTCQRWRLAADHGIGSVMEVGVMSWGEASSPSADGCVINIRKLWKFLSGNMNI